MQGPNGLYQPGRSSQLWIAVLSKVLRHSKNSSFPVRDHPYKLATMSRSIPIHAALLASLILAGCGSGGDNGASSAPPVTDRTAPGNTTGAPTGTTPTGTTGTTSTGITSTGTTSTG